MLWCHLCDVGRESSLGVGRRLTQPLDEGWAKHPACDEDENEDECKDEDDDKDKDKDNEKDKVRRRKKGKNGQKDTRRHGQKDLRTKGQKDKRAQGDMDTWSHGHKETWKQRTRARTTDRSMTMASLLAVRKSPEAATIPG